MIDTLKQPKRHKDGSVDQKWWDSLPLEEKLEYEVWESEVMVEEKTSPMEIVIKPEALDLSILSNGSDNKAIWRPSTFDEYVGQDNLKKILKGYIRGTKDLNKTFPHIMIDGKAGTGKTTICYLLAKYLDVNFVEAVATTIKTQQQLVDKIAECNGGVLFLDEVHMLGTELCNFILPILEDFQINGVRIKPFTLFSATTEKGTLLKKFKPLVDRMKIQFTLEDYSVEELCFLTEQFKKKTYPDVELDKEAFMKVAKNSRCTPRIAIRYLESCIFMQCSVEEVFETYNIVKNGITKEDIKVLTLLKDYEKGVGLQAISAFLGTSQENFLYSIESYLLQQGLMTRLSRGRAITEKGKQLLQEVG